MSQLFIPVHDRLARTPAGRCWALMLLLMACLGLGMPMRMHAQINGDTLLQDDSPVVDEDLPQDSIPPKKVDEKTDFLDPVALMNGTSSRRVSGFKPDDLLYPDMLERQGGFYNTLGQWGMPYQRYKYGTDAANFDQGNYVNPITGAENVYFIDPENGMRYFDTRTPYLNAYYGQGKADAAQMRVDLSQNVHPLVNVAGLYYRQQCKGVYTNLVTAHTAAGASTNFHTLNDRYQVFGHFLIQEHKDQINGGVILVQQDSSLFGQGSQPVSLLDANLKRLSRAIALKQFYRFTKDTLQAKHSLSAYSGFFTDYLLNYFTDHDVASDVNFGLFPVYPTLGASTNIYEIMTFRRIKVDGGLTYRLNTPVWKSHQRFEIAQELIHYKRFADYTDLNRSTFLWKGGLNYDPNPRSLELNWTYRQTFSNLFRTESYGEMDVAYRFPKWLLDYSYKVPGPALKPMDSTSITKSHRPLAIVVHTLSYGRNPTLQQAYGTPWSGVGFDNAFVPNPRLQNRRIQHVRVGIELNGKDNWTKFGEQVGNHLRVSLFSTRQTGMIYYAGDSNFVQANPRQFVLYSGIELKLRVHTGPVYLESETVAQGFQTNSKQLENEFVRNQPKFYSKTSIFYENRNLKFCRLLRFGADFWYFSTYKAPFFDPASQAFYAQDANTSYFQLAYPRADVIVATQVKKAFIFLKFINLLEGLPGLDGLPAYGYFTTMGYPMQTRQLQLGLNWTFFD